MKKLLLMRHSDAVISHLGAPDHARKLSKRGIDNSIAVGQNISAANLIPDLIISSDSNRTLETSKNLGALFSLPRSVIASKNTFYNAKAFFIFNELSRLQSDINTLLVVAHNPGISELADQLSTTPINPMSTSQCIYLRFEIQDWGFLNYSEGVHLQTFKPE